MSRDDELQPGDLYAGYIIAMALKHGGMGEVYGARHEINGRFVVIKLINNKHMKADTADVIVARERFRQEIQVLLKLQHPHIVPILDEGEVDGQKWMAMPFIRAGEKDGLPYPSTLEDYLQEPLQSATSWRMLRQIADALDYLHEDVQLVHRDLKPANILVDARKNVWFADFGIAKWHEKMTQPGMPPGTPLYMSPEQCLDQPLDGRSDVYALGVVIYQWLAGKPPFSADNPFAMSSKHLHDEPPWTPLESNAWAIPVLKQALQKRPTDRHATAGELVAALASAHASKSTPRIAEATTSLITTTSAPPWAKSSGTDSYGRWADWSLKGVIQRLRLIEPGEFLMGSPSNESERSDDEGPRHRVRIRHSFWLADTACTQALWLAVMNGGNPSHFLGDPECPVERVSWDDITQGFFPRLQPLLPRGWQLALPTEAQWEYACRAGHQEPFSFGPQITPEQVNYDGNHPYPGGKKGLYRARTVAVKVLPCNDWGLYQMHGNVWEWCADSPRSYTEPSAGQCFEDPEGPPEMASRALRGGGWIRSAWHVRSADRLSSGRENCNYLIGFRLALRSIELGRPEG